MLRRGNYSFPKNLRFGVGRAKLGHYERTLHLCVLGLAVRRRSFSAASNVRAHGCTGIEQADGTGDIDII